MPSTDMIFFCSDKQKKHTPEWEDNAVAVVFCLHRQLFADVVVKQTMRNIFYDDDILYVLFCSSEQQQEQQQNSEFN